LVRNIGSFEKWRVGKSVIKLQCLKQIQRKRAMVRKIGRFEKSRVRRIGIHCIKQYFLVVLFIMLYKVVLTFKSEDEILMCDHSNESY